MKTIEYALAAFAALIGLYLLYAIVMFVDAAG